MAAADAPAFTEDDRPRTIVVRVSPGDRIFRGVLRSAGILVLVMTAGILAFLALQSVPAFKAVGFRFFTTSTWFISTNQFGIAAILPLAVLIALIALIIAIPVGLATALFLCVYAPRRLRRTPVELIALQA